jgi:hypothetical protein
MLNDEIKKIKLKKIKNYPSQPELTYQTYYMSHEIKIIP